MPTADVELSSKGRYAYLGLERRRTGTAGLLHRFLLLPKLLFARPLSAHLHVRSLHSSRCSDRRSHFSPAYCGLFSVQGC
ncbi:conserved hypothetical protein [Thiomonas arsenitoxydans]|uniref:Uncharacterized protein n=1 Tax=Thiomonas arsenitoxydans (strain DSM 22701 / CIP 110005 / 3As) TaxID=426114 RepID=D6CMM5_THIA3|nr:hypothetical protein THI_3206 [Thiomonas arsenitoxydans]CQR39471.1 conserved hypothetical protein [Thiomonas arsenitoxydans]CQR39648.1 conserved hypothetical protein [Thiomonas arsenitoxydans]